MPDLNHFRTFEISQDGGGSAFELSRTDERVICLAFDARFGCFCEIAALTQLAEEGSPVMEAFLEQAGVLAGLHHPGLASLLDYGDDQGVRFYAVEFVDGETISDFASRVIGLPPALAFGLCADLADALCAISVLSLPIAAGNARVTLDDRGRLRVRLADYPLGLQRPEGPRDPAAAVFELAHLLEHLASGKVIGEKGLGAAAVGDVAGRLRQLESIHDAGQVLREAAGDGHFIAVEPRHRPRLLLAQKLFSRGSPEEYLSDDYRVEQVSPAAADPYSIAVVRVSESLPLRMHVLPPAYILSDQNLPIYETEKSSAVVGAEALWRSEHFRLVSEDRFPGFSLTTLLRQAGELSDMEVMLLLDHIETAILEARSAGAELAKVHPDNVLVRFVGCGFDEAEGMMTRRPLTAWPEFSIMLRAHQTMRGLTTLTPNAKHRFVQMRAALERGERVSNLAVLELYLQLHDSGRAEQAEELLDRFEQSCKAAVAAAAALAELEEQEVEEELVSPIAQHMSEEAFGLDEEEGEQAAQASLGSLASGVLFGSGHFEGVGYEDEDDFDRGDDLVVISPIAAALGIVADDSDAVYGAGFAQKYDTAQDFGQPGFGGSSLGGGGARGEHFADDDELVSPFGKGRLPDRDRAGWPPQLDRDEDFDDELEADSDGGSRGLVFFLILAGVAVVLAAIIAQLTGKAFWLR